MYMEYSTTAGYTVGMGCLAQALIDQAGINQALISGGMKTNNKALNKKQAPNNQLH